MIEIVDKSKCCGCGACFNACPQHCITMTADKEEFLYPFVQTEKCVHCDLCEKVCPILNVKEDVPFEQEAYIIQLLDERIREDSTAGGAFTAIANYVLEQGGVVFGVAYDDNFKVHHTKVESQDDLYRFRNSKYVQSDTGDTFSQVQAYLKKGKMVCYSGTPCQIEGLKAFLGKEYSCLITVDVVCHAVPSPLVWQKYIEMQREKYGNSIGNIRFRDKHYGYKYSTMTVKSKQGKDLYAYGIDTDPMLRAFFSNICDRQSCYDCKFKKRYRVSDFTIWDCYPVYKFNKAMDDDKGTTRLLIHSAKGNQIFSHVKEQVKWFAVSPDALTENVKEMYKSIPMNSKREQFFEDAVDMKGTELFNKYFPMTLMVRAERFIRLVLIKTRLYSLVKQIAGRLMDK